MSIEGLTGIGQVELELDADRPACVFLGENGVGKTKLLEALHLVTFRRDALVDVLQDAFGVDVNVLKRESLSGDSQRSAKAGLLDLLGRV